MYIDNTNSQCDGANFPLLEPAQSALENNINKDSCAPKRAIYFDHFASSKPGTSNFELFDTAFHALYARRRNGRLGLFSFDVPDILGSNYVADRAVCKNSSVIVEKLILELNKFIKFDHFVAGWERQPEHRLRHHLHLYLNCDLTDEQHVEMRQALMLAWGKCLPEEAFTDDDGEVHPASEVFKVDDVESRNWVMRDANADYRASYLLKKGPRQRKDNYGNALSTHKRWSIERDLRRMAEESILSFYVPCRDVNESHEFYKVVLSLLGCNHHYAFNESQMKIKKLVSCTGWWEGLFPSDGWLRVCESITTHLSKENAPLKDHVRDFVTVRLYPTGAFSLNHRREPLRRSARKTTSKPRKSKSKKRRNSQSKLKL